jgi:hypothetical protein
MEFGTPVVVNHPEGLFGYGTVVRETIDDCVIVEFSDGRRMIFPSEYVKELRTEHTSAFRCSAAPEDPLVTELKAERNLYRSLLVEVADNVATKMYPVPKGLYSRIEKALTK